MVGGIRRLQRDSESTGSIVVVHWHRGGSAYHRGFLSEVKRRSFLRDKYGSADDNDSADAGGRNRRAFGGTLQLPPL